MNTRFQNIKPLSILLAAIFSCASVYAEAPMVTDDAGTMDQGGKKVEGSFAKSGPARVYGLSGGFAPMDNVEIGLGLQHARDSSLSTSGNATGLSVKWIPIKSGIFSAGLKLDHVRAKSGGAYANATTLTGLTSARFASGYVLHANVGRTNTSGGAGHVNNWAVGFEVPVAEKLQLTFDLYSSTNSDNGKQLGARWEAQKGLKLSAAVGRYNTENTVFAGFSWEF